VRHQLAYLGVAYLVIWAGIAGYLVHLARRQRAVERRLNELEGPDQRAHE
jgi:CcmD family protein